MYAALKEEIAARGLAKLEARVCTSSCLDQCATGVTVLVEPDHFFYGRVTAADVPEIVDGLVTGQPVKRLVLTADQHNGAKWDERLRRENCEGSSERVRAASEFQNIVKTVAI